MFVPAEMEGRPWDLGKTGLVIVFSTSGLERHCKNFFLGKYLRHWIKIRPGKIFDQRIPIVFFFSENMRGILQNMCSLLSITFF